MVYHNNYKTKTVSLSDTAANKVTTPNKTATTINPDLYAGWHTYITSDNAITLNYPSDWVTDKCTKTATCSSDTQKIDTYLAPLSNPSWRVIGVSHDTSNLTPKQYYDQDGNNINTGSNGPIDYSNSNSINGNPSYFVHFAPTTSSGIISSFSDYIISHNKEIVELQFVDINGGGSDTTPFRTIFTEVANSVKFKN